METEKLIVESVQIDTKLQIVPFDPDDITDVLGNPEARVWIDLEGFQAGDLETWLDKLNIQDLARRLCLEAHERPGFYPLKNEILLVIPILTPAGSSNEAAHVTFFIRKNLLLTFHQKHLLNPQTFSNLLATSEAWLSERSIAALVSAIMVQQSNATLRHIAELRSKVFDLEQEMDRDPENIEAEQIMDLRSTLLKLGALVSDQMPPLQSLKATEKSFFPLKGAQVYMNCALTNLQAADGSLTWLDQRVSGLHAGFHMHSQDKTNRRLNMLTILSAIFTPLTFLAGIWGMNFEVMPELKVPFGYFAALLFMGAIGLGMFAFLRRNGWFE